MSSALPMAALGLGALVLLAPPRRSRAAAKPSRSPERPAPSRTELGRWADDDAPRRIRALADPIERLADWPGLGDYLVAVAWTESRGNPDAVAGSTGARGWFQLIPSTAAHPRVLADPTLLHDERWAVATAADLVYRLAVRWGLNKGFQPDWAAIRRGWRYPSLVIDADEFDPNSKRVGRHFVEGLVAAGLGPGFARESPIPERWPGRDALLQAVGV